MTINSKVARTVLATSGIILYTLYLHRCFHALVHESRGKGKQVSNRAGVEGLNFGLFFCGILQLWKVVIKFQKN